MRRGVVTDLRESDLSNSALYEQGSLWPKPAHGKRVLFAPPLSNFMDAVAASYSFHFSSTRRFVESCLWKNPLQVVFPAPRSSYLTPQTSTLCMTAKREEGVCESKLREPASSGFPCTSF